MNRRLIILLLIVIGCEGILAPELLLVGKWLYKIYKTTNIETGEIIEEDLGFSEEDYGAILQINRNGTASQYFTSLGLPFNERNYTWSANGNQLTYHCQDSTVCTVTMDYSINGDTLIFTYPRELVIVEETYIKID